jgi:hypothetical protein
MDLKKNDAGSELGKPPPRAQADAQHRAAPRTLCKLAGALRKQPAVPGLDELLGGAA